MSNSIDEQYEHWLETKNAYAQNLKANNGCLKSIKQIIEKIDKKLEQLRKEKEYKDIKI